MRLRLLRRDRCRPPGTGEERSPVLVGDDRRLLQRLAGLAFEQLDDAGVLRVDRLQQVECLAHAAPS